MAGGGHAIGAAHDDAAPRHRGLVDGGQRARAVAHDAGPLGLDADLEARDVHQVHHRQVEGLRQVDEARELLGRWAIPAAAVEIRVAGHHGHGPAVDTRQPGDDGAAPLAPHLQKRALVHQAFDDGSDLVDLAAVARNGREQPFVAACGIVADLSARGQPVDRRRQVGQEAAHALEGFLLAGHLVVHHAVARMDLAAAQLLLGHVLADARHHRRPGIEQLGRALDHQRVVAGRHARRAHAGHRAQRQRHHGHGGEVFDHLAPDLHGRHAGVALGLDVAHRAATARAVHQAHHGQAQVVRHLLGKDQLVAHGAVAGAAAHGEVVAHHHYGPPAYACAPHHQVGRGELHQSAQAVVLARAGERAHFREGIRVRAGGDALAHRQLARGLVARHLVVSAHLRR